MSEKEQQEHISKKRVVYRLEGMEAVAVSRDVEYLTTDAGERTMDVYYPPQKETASQLPAVVFVAGYPDPGYQRIMGCTFKEMGSSVSWAQLVAVSGLAAITYTNIEPEQDLNALLSHVRRNAPALQLDPNRIAVWACSGNAPLALSTLMQDDHEYLSCGVLCYGYMLDLEGHSGVADAAKQWKFANPGAGKSFDDLPVDLPLFIVRAGQDQMPQLNDTLDRFLGQALKRNLPVTFVNHAEAPHAFDLFHDTESTRDVIQQILRFLQYHLLAVKEQ